MARNVADQTTAAVEPATTIDPQPEAPAPPPPPPPPPSSSSSSATTKSSSDDDPLDVEHYIPRLPLQLAAIAFALAAPVAAAAATGSRNSSAVPRPAQVLAAWIDAPRETLAFQSALVAVVQVWFGYWARSCRTGRGRNTKTPRTTRVEQVERSRSAARRTAPKGFGAIMNHIWHNDIRKIGTESILRGGEGANRNFGGVDYSVSSRLSFDCCSPAARKLTRSSGICTVCTRDDPRHSARHRRLPRFGSLARRSTHRVRTPFLLRSQPPSLSSSLYPLVCSDASVTLLLSLLLALLAVTPLAIAVPPFQSTADGYTWLRLLSTLSSVRSPSSLLFLSSPQAATPRLTT